MSATACLVTRGDVELDEILDSLSAASEIDEVLVWDNGAGTCKTYDGRKWGVVAEGLPDLAVFGRYAAIEYARNDLVYVQDDDCLLGMEGVEEICWMSDSGGSAYGQLVCNMPDGFRYDFYREHSLVGFGACFHRDLPERAFEQFWNRADELGVLTKEMLRAGGLFQRTCDVIFTALTTRVLVDVPYRDMPWASDDNRMWKQPTHVGERTMMLELCRSIAKPAGGGS